MSLQGKLWGGAAGPEEKAAVSAVSELVGYDAPKFFGHAGSDRVEINGNKITVHSVNEVFKGGDTAVAKHDAVREKLTDAGLVVHDKGSVTDNLVTGLTTASIEIDVGENGGLAAVAEKAAAAAGKGQQEQAGGFAAREAARRASGQGQSQGRGG